LLAAGSSTRFGGFKLMHPIDGVPMVLRSAIAMRTALGAIFVAVRPGSPCVPTLLEQGFDVISCPRADEGMGGTLADAVAQVSAHRSLASPGAPEQALGYIVALADMPFIAPESIRAVARALQAGARLAAPVYRGERGHPVGLAASYRDELLALKGDAGARAIIKRDAALMTLVDVDDPGVLRDIDTPADLRHPGQ
jgi:molybdenum cofactor cytidylyltransferase